jgi:hypothetical protein
VLAHNRTSQSCTNLEISPFSIAERTLLGGSQLKKLLLNADEEHATGFYLSPRAGSKCLQALGFEDPLELSLAMNRIAAALRPLEFGVYRNLGFPGEPAPGTSFSTPEFAGSTAHDVRYCGSGMFGSAYEIGSADTSSFILKIFHKRAYELNFSGPWNECALGMYITHQGVSDLPHLCAADPAQEWLLCEYVSSTFRSSNPSGPTIRELGLQVLDPIQDDRNLVRGMETNFRVDYGHLKTDDRMNYFPERTMSEIRREFKKSGFLDRAPYLALFGQDASARPYICSNLGMVRPRDRLATIEAALDLPETTFFPLSDLIAANIMLKEETLDLFTMQMNHPNSEYRTQALYDLQGVNSASASLIRKAWAERDEFSLLRTVNPATLALHQFDVRSL